MVHDTRAIHFPYCLQKRKDKLWIVLNRNYKPIGVATSEWADYDAVPVDACIKSMSPEQASKLSYDGSPDNSGSVYLYNDGCIPTDSKSNMEAYLTRLAVLMKLKLASSKQR